MAPCNWLPTSLWLRAVVMLRRPRRATLQGLRLNKRICVMRMAFLPYLIPPERQFVDGLAARGYDVTVIKSRVRDRSKREEDRPGMRNIMWIW